LDAICKIYGRIKKPEKKRRKENKNRKRPAGTPFGPASEASPQPRKEKPEPVRCAGLSLADM
jgi:hypothetical protein